ncbi:MAG TPA: glucose 1-dehydrogenase [Stellaceae bacterium]|nr:glucose 1-dehydrogenase [Stellaceae bacterium]
MNSGASHRRASRLHGKTALVSGAAGGIGRAIAQLFADAGAAVACCDIDHDGATETARLIEQAGGRALAQSCDVAVETETRAAAAATHAAFGRLDILVSGAAPHDAGGTILEIEPAEWQQVVTVNLTGSYLLCRAALPLMIAGGGGSIILIASQLGRVGSAGRAAYCATKGALIQLAKVMAIDHAGDNVRVNTLSPGAVETGRLLRRYCSLAAARDTLAPKHLMQRLGQPGEIAAAALFLASDDASFVTGSDLLADGGYTAV